MAGRMTYDLYTMATGHRHGKPMQLWQLECLKKTIIDSYYFSRLRNEQLIYYTSVYRGLRGWK